MAQDIKGLTVTLAEDMPKEFAEKLADAIRQMRGVSVVELVETDRMDDSHIKFRTDQEWRERLMKLVRGSF